MKMVRVRSKSMKKALIKKQTEWITLSTKNIGLNTNVNGWDRTLKCLIVTIITGLFLHVHFTSNSSRIMMIQNFKNFRLIKDSEMSTHFSTFVICSIMSLLGLLSTMIRNKKKKKKKILFKLIKYRKKLSI